MSSWNHGQVTCNFIASFRGFLLCFQVNYRKVTASLKFHSSSSFMITFPLVERYVTFTIHITPLNTLRLETTYEKKAVNLWDWSFSNVVWHLTPRKFVDRYQGFVSGELPGLFFKLGECDFSILKMEAGWFSETVSHLRWS